MLLPVGIAHPYQRLPVATWSLMGLNVVMAMATVATGFEGIAPLVLDADDFALYQLVSYQFLHAGIFHLAGNMLFLWVYGRYVEERMGPWRYTGIYLACGVIGGLFFVGFTDGSCVGASGAISGVMGFVLVGAPWAEVRVLFLWGPYGTFNRKLRVAAFWLVGFWIVFQLLMAVATWGMVSGVAYGVHIGGFLAGAGLALYLRSPTCEGKSWYLDPAPPGGGREATRRLCKARGAAARTADAPRFYVEIQSLDDVSSRVAVIRLLMKHLGMEPEAAHRRLEHVERGEAQELAFGEKAAASRFAREARGLGVEVAFEEAGEQAPPPPTPQASSPPPDGEPLDVDLSRPPAPPPREIEAPPEKRKEELPPIRLASGQVLEVESDSGKEQETTG